VKHKINNIATLVGYNIFPAINILCLIALVFPNMRLGVASSVLILIVLALTKGIWKYALGDRVFSAFILINILSVFSYLYNGRPIIIYIAAASYTLIPSMLYYLGAVHANQYDFSAVGRKILYTAVFILAFGLFFYFLFPDFYYEHIGQSLDQFVHGKEDYRFGSYIDSINLGSVCVSSIPLTFLLPKNKFSTPIRIAVWGVILTALMLSMQRSAWVVAILMIIALFIMSMRGKVSRRKVCILGLCCLAALCVIVVILVCLDSADYFLVRLKSINPINMLKERWYQWEAGFDIVLKNPWGFGMGSLGHKAAQYGLGVVCDCNYLRILGETGVVGFALFIIVNIRAINVTIQRRNLLGAMVLCGFYLQAIGSNVMDLFFCSFIYWYILGYLTYCSQKNKLGHCNPNR